jgi:glutathione S-transferase
MVIEMLKLYYSPGACSLTAHIALEEIGIPYEKELVPVGDGTSSERWRKINPKGFVPALLGVPGAMGGSENLLTEANAILFYLGRKFPEAQLLPPTPEGEARCLEWLGFLSGTVHSYSVAQVWRPGRFVEYEKDFAAVEAKGKSTLPQHSAYIERLLADGRDWAVPGYYTVADSYLLAIYRWAKRIGQDINRYPAWMDHAARMLKRPAVARAFADEGITL